MIASDGPFGCSDGASGNFDMAFGGRLGVSRMDRWTPGWTDRPSYRKKDLILEAILPTVIGVAQLSELLLLIKERIIRQLSDISVQDRQ